MPSELTYSIDHSISNVHISLIAERFNVTTQGKGALDKQKNIDIGVADIQKFCLVPTVLPQNLHSARSAGDFSYDAEFIFSYLKDGKVEKKRVFVNSQDPSFTAILSELKQMRPDASLLHLEPSDAQKEIGAISASSTVAVIIGLLVGVPMLIAAIYIIYLALT